MNRHPWQYVLVVVAKAGGDAAAVHHRLVNTIIVLVNKKCIGKWKNLPVALFCHSLFVVHRPSVGIVRCRHFELVGQMGVDVCWHVDLRVEPWSVGGMKWQAEGRKVVSFCCCAQTLFRVGLFYLVTIMSRRVVSGVQSWEPYSPWVAFPHHCSPMHVSQPPPPPMAVDNDNDNDKGMKGQGKETRAGAWDVTCLKPQVCFFFFFCFTLLLITYR